MTEEGKVPNGRTPGALDRAGALRLFAGPGTIKPFPSKVMGLDEAVRRHVAAGMTLHFAYSEGRPMAASNALARAFRGTTPGFVLVGSGFVANQAALVQAGLVRRMEASFVGENYPTPGPHPVFQRAIDSGAIEFEAQSLLVVQQRLAAGAFGFPFALTRSWLDTSLARNESFREIADPFGGDERVGAVRALVPDITFVHGLAADPQGNVLLSPPFGEGEVAAFAARAGVIATVERIVSPDVIARHAHLARIPAHRVLSVSETPLGCHPYGIYVPGDLDVSAYVDDYAFFRDLRATSARPELFERWAEEWIFGVADHEDYLRKLGSSRVAALRGAAAPGAWLDDLDGGTLAGVEAIEGYTSTEMMVVEAAHVLERKVADEGYGILEAGVGFANLAAWLALCKLQTELGVPAELVAEIGIYGFLPKPGEPFIFSNRNLPSCKSMTGVEAILGMYVAGRHNNCLAIIGAGQIDPAGNINSTFSSDGRYLVGSGGANDIAAGARDIIAVTKQSRSRLTAELPYVTSAGARVSTLVTDLGVFEKRGGPSLVLTRYFPVAGKSEQEVVSLIRTRCGWELDVADRLEAALPPARDELLRLRLYDLRGDFLKERART